MNTTYFIRNSFLLILFNCLLLHSVAQNNFNYVIKFVNVDFKGTDTELTTKLSPNGLYLVPNGVYDLIINDKKYYGALLLNVHKDKFIISTDWHSKTKKINDSIVFYTKYIKSFQMRFNSTIESGIVIWGLNNKTLKKQFEFSIIKHENLNKFKVVSYINKNKKYYGYFFPTHLDTYYAFRKKFNLKYFRENGDFLVLTKIKYKTRFGYKESKKIYRKVD